MPEAAKADTKAGAVAFVKWYVELINHAQATGDVEALESVATSECKSCENAKTVIKRVYEAGGTIEGGALTFQPISTDKRPDIHGWIVIGGASSGPQTTKIPGSPPEHHNGGRAPLNFLVSAKGGQMRVVEWTRGG